MVRLNICLVPLMLVFMSCEKDIGTQVDSFTLTILTIDSTVLSGVRVDAQNGSLKFTGTTSADGTIAIPLALQGGAGSMVKTDFIPTPIRDLRPGTILLPATTKRLREIGQTDGQVVRFAAGGFATFDFRGVYRYYTFSDFSVSLNMSTRFSDTVIAIHRFTPIGDTLWFTTRDTSIYSILLTQPAQPAVLHRFRLPAVAGPIGVRDSLIVIGEESYPGAIRILTYNSVGMRQLSSIQYLFPKQVRIVGNYAIFYDGDPLYAAFDISSPALPRLVHLGQAGGYVGARIIGNHLVLTPASSNPTSEFAPIKYEVRDIKDPANPGFFTHLYSDSWITSIASPTYATGTSFYHSGTLTIVNGGIGGTYRTVAAITGSTAPLIDGASPPYFVFGGKLWKLESR